MNAVYSISSHYKLQNSLQYKENPSPTIIDASTSKSTTNRSHFSPLFHPTHQSSGIWLQEKKWSKNKVRRWPWQIVEKCAVEKLPGAGIANIESSPVNQPSVIKLWPDEKCGTLPTSLDSPFYPDSKRCSRVIDTWQKTISVLEEDSSSPEWADPLFRCWQSFESDKCGDLREMAEREFRVAIGHYYSLHRTLLFERHKTWSPDR